VQRSARCWRDTWKSPTYTVALRPVRSIRPLGLRATMTSSSRSSISRQPSAVGRRHSSATISLGEPGTSRSLG
jgi:hypothetical protein